MEFRIGGRRGCSVTKGTEPCGAFIVKMKVSILSVPFGSFKGTDRIGALGNETKSSDGSVPMREIGRVRHSKSEHGTQCQVYPTGTSLPRHPTGDESAEDIFLDRK